MLFAKEQLYEPVPEETAENVVQNPGSLLFQNILETRKYILLGLLLVVMSVILYTTIPIFIPQHHQPVTSSCGNTTSSARERGCSFDMISFSWQTPECFNEPLVSEFAAWDNWTFYTEKRGTTTVPTEVALQGEKGLWVSWEYHMVHCTFVWRQLQTGFERGYVDSHLLTMTAHALQRIASSPRSVSTIIHIAGLLFFAASFSWLPNITNPLHNGFGGSYQFLTIIALTISTMTFGVGLLADVSLSEQLFALKNKLSVCATPLEVLVSILYWSLRAVDKKFVVPPGHELPFIPDFGFHAMPAIMLILDMILLSPPWPIKAHNSMTLGSVLALLYWGWIEYCFSLNEWYPYPILALLSTWQKLFLCIISAALIAGTTVFLKWVYGRVNGVEEFRRGAFNPIKID